MGCVAICKLRACEGTIPYNVSRQPGQLSRQSSSLWAGRPEFYSRQGQDFLFFIASRTALAPTQTSYPMGTEGLPKESSSRGAKLITHLHLVLASNRVLYLQSPRSPTSTAGVKRSYTSNPPDHLHLVPGSNRVIPPIPPSSASSVGVKRSQTSNPPSRHGL